MQNETAHFFRESPGRSLIGTLDVRPLVCGYAVEKADLGRVHPFRSDPFFRMYYPIAGQLQASGCSGEVLIRPGKLYLFPAHVPFRFLNQGGFTHKWVHFTSGCLQRLPGFRKILSVPFREEYAPLWDELLALAERDDGSSAAFLRADSVLRQLLLPFVENLEETLACDFNDQIRFQPAVDYVASHLAEDVTTEKMAKQCGMRKNDFSKAFRSAYGIAPKQYLINMRMERARELLLTTGEPVKSIASRCGYDNEFYFFRFFRKHAHTTPTAFRARYQLG